MSKTKNRKKILVSRETLLNLRNEDLARINAGRRNTNDDTDDPSYQGDGIWTCPTSRR
jgi:hypothetical protein